jgi:NAD(P)-dependent dehydrogenase (short-subunit alcohol dehydrogenase family)
MSPATSTPGHCARPDGIVTAGGKAVAIQADASQSEERDRPMSEVIEQVGAPDILVNNAAVTFLRPLTSSRTSAHG